jgi:hypothetical protein
MGVKGFDLLEIANKKGIPALMLTAHALTKDALKESAERGASYFAPKPNGSAHSTIESSPAPTGGSRSESSGIRS